MLGVTLVTGCGGAADSLAGTDPGREPGDDDISMHQEPDPDAGPAADDNHPTGAAVYYCDGIRLTLEQLSALDVVPSPSADAFERAASGLALGERDRWAQLAPALLIDRTTLPTEPPGLVVAADGAGPVACVASRAGDVPAVAWRVERITTDEDSPIASDSTSSVLVAAIESCVSGDAITTEVRMVDGDAIVDLFEAPGAVRRDTSCLVDGSNRIEADLPEGFDGDVLASRTWPFVPPDPNNWISSHQSPPVAPIARSDVDNADCVAISDHQAVNIEWRGVPGGAAIEILRDGQLVSSAGRSTGNRRIERELEQAFAARLQEYGADGDKPQNPPDGLASELPGGAPDGVFSLFGASAGTDDLYQLRVTDADLAVTVPCEIMVQPEPDTGEDTGEESRTEPADLDQAKELFARSALGAHVYITVVLDGVTTELYLDGERSFRPPLVDDEFINPFTLHDDLAAAVAAGLDVDYVLDPGSGVPTSWTVDGVERELLCLELDTAPPDLREIGCDPTTDLITRD